MWGWRLHTPSHLSLGPLTTLPGPPPGSLKPFVPLARPQHTATLDRGLAGVSAPPSLPTHTCWLPLHSAFPQPKLRVPAPCRPT